MKAKTFENLIRKIVREEIDYALRREIKSLKEDLRDDLKPVIKEQPIIQKDSLKEKIMGTSSQQIFKKSFKPKQFTNNNTLNSLLNETAMGDTSLDSGHAPISAGIGDMPAEAIPTEVANAVNRDYSSLMKAIDKKRNK